MNFFSSSRLIALARTSNILFTRSAKSGHPYLVLVLTRMTYSFSLWSVLPVGLSQMSFLLCWSTFYSYFSERKYSYRLKYCVSVQFSSVIQSCLTLWDPMNCSTPGHPVHHQLPEFTQTHVHRVSDAIQSSHPLSAPSPPAPSPSQREGLFQWVNSSHEVAKVLELQL